jgi:hypothetical protein
MFGAEPCQQAFRAARALTPTGGMLCGDPAGGYRKCDLLPPFPPISGSM